MPRIRAQIRPRISGPQPFVQLGALSVRATVRDRPIALSVEEFTLLRFSAMHLDEVLPLLAILAEVWGSPDTFEPTLADHPRQPPRRAYRTSVRALVLTSPPRRFASRWRSGEPTLRTDRRSFEGSHERLPRLRSRWHVRKRRVHGTPLPRPKALR